MDDDKVFADVFNIEDDVEGTPIPTQQTTTTQGGGGMSAQNYIASKMGLEILKMNESPAFKMIERGTMYDNGAIPGPEANMSYFQRMSVIKKERLRTKRTLGRSMQFLGAFLGDANMLALAKEHQKDTETAELIAMKGDLSINILSNQDKYSKEEVWQARRNLMSDYKDIYGAETLGKNVGAASYQATADATMYQGYNYMFPAIANALGTTGSGSNVTTSPDDIALMKKILDMSSNKQLPFSVAQKMADQFPDNEKLRGFIFKHMNSDIPETDRVAAYVSGLRNAGKTSIDIGELDAVIRSVMPGSTNSELTY